MPQLGGCELFDLQRVFLNKEIKMVKSETLVAHYEASEEEKTHQEVVMRRGNRVLDIYHERVKAREEFPRKYSKSLFCKELFESIAKGGTVNVRGIMIPSTDVALIKKVKEIEFSILQTYSRLLCKRAKVWESRNRHGILNFDDFYSEGVTGLLKAIYSYVRDDVKFFTFVHGCIDNACKSAINKAKPLSHWTNHDIKLYGEFEKTRVELSNKSGIEVSFDDVAELMGLDEETISDLRDMLRNVTNLSDTSYGRVGNAGEEIEVYEFAAPEEETVSDFNLESFINVPMSEWEKTVLDAFLTGKRGWATEVAKAHINPLTITKKNPKGKPYSRRAPAVALDRVLARLRDKHKNKYEQAEAA